MEKEYLDISSSQDLKNPKDKFLYRTLEFVPGIIIWATISLAVLLSWLAPAIVAVFIIVFDLFWLFRVSYLSFHQIASYKHMKKNIAENWLLKLEKLEDQSWKKIFHLVIIPTYKEDLEVLKPTFQALAKSEYSKKKIIVVLATEERAGITGQTIAEKIKAEFGNVFFQFLITAHPKDMPGEIGGKGSNFAFAFMKAKHEIVDKLSIPYEDIIVSNFDSDTRPYSQYFSRLTWCFLHTEEPLRTSFQPIPVYNNNIWQAPAFSRIIAVSGTFWQMMQQERKEQLVSYSSHAMPFLALAEVGYPYNMVSDDSRIFWKSFLFYDGEYKTEPLHYPVSMDAVLAEDLKKTIVNQYKQQRRWAWGCENIPYLIFNFIKNKKIKIGEKLRHTLIILDGFWSWAAVALFTFFLGWLPLWLGGDKFQTTLLSYNLPKLTSYIMTAAMAGMIVSAIMSFLLLPPMPEKFGKKKKLSMLFQWLLLPFTLIFFGSMPAIESQTRLLMGKRLGFWPTEKHRNN